MRILGFVEGALTNKGGIGIVGVPRILGSTAARGHRVALIVGGPPIAGCERVAVPDLQQALERNEGAGTFGVVTFKSWKSWAFAPAILWRTNRYARAADFVILNSLYSFPVLAGYLLARLHRKPYGIWLHGVLAPVQRRIGARKKRLYDGLIAQHIMRNTAVIFYSGGRERDEAQEAYVIAAACRRNGTAAELRARSVVVPCGFDATEYTELPPRGLFRERRLQDHKGPVVLFLARLNAKKGLRLLTQAMALVLQKHPETRLAIVGPPDPPDFENDVRGWVRESGIESKAFLTGKVDPATKLQALADADVYVLPSENENFGYSVFEAMASGIPVVVSNTLDYAGEIASAEAGFAVEREPERFAAKILELLEKPELRRRMGENGGLLAKRYSLEETAGKVERTIECILQRRPLPADLTRS
jgi:glycosyltransferase involved in cell wall biosynthesis